MAEKAKRNRGSDRQSVPAKRDPHTMRHRTPPGQTPAEAAAGYLVEGIAQNTLAAFRFASDLPTVDITEAFAESLRASRKIVEGDLGSLEAMLGAQAVTCNAIFTDLSARAQRNYQNGEIFERLLRLALKAQSQCRATAESLALMKNPPIFAKQANVTSGPQQVNNVVSATAIASRATNSESEPNKLLEAHGERLEGGTAQAAGSSNQDLATMGKVHRSAKHRR